MDNLTLVLPSARAIRHEQLQIQQETLFLPNYITMSEFISKLTVVKDFKTVDDDRRVLLLLEASDFNEFTKLQIQRNFFTFTKNSSYIFKFFEELSAELYDISDLNTSDIYGEYEEHILILQELYKRYEKLCSERKILDRIFLPKLYKFNTSYASSHARVVLNVDGHLTNFEFELLLQVAECCEIRVNFRASKFNAKMQQKFLELLELELEVGYEYEISLNTKSILKKESVDIKTKISCESFSESLLQVAFIKQKLYEFVQKGYEPQNIAVILPDEKMAQNLKTFDSKSNFNFAMGESYTTSKIYKKLQATFELLGQESQESSARVERVGDELYSKMLQIYYKNANEVDVMEFLESAKEESANKIEKKIYEEELHSFAKLLFVMQEMGVKSVLSLFLQRLAKRTLDDVRGGKVTVMGVLETRSVAFDGVIIVDFSDSNVPKKSDKDMFLNSSLREMANLPTMSDRENLQKHYYEMLISNSKEVAISYVSSTESSPSRFLKLLGIEQTHLHDELEYASILFKRSLKVTADEEPIIQEYSFKDIKLSATRLKTFLTCKRKYYHRYVQHINAHDIPRDMPEEWAIGIDVHTALKELYSKKNSYSNVQELRRDLQRELDSACGESELEKYLISMQKKRLEPFCHKEIERFAQGWEVYRCEESLSVEFAGMTLVGQIDRVDKRNNEIEVIDYKTGSYTLYTEKKLSEARDFQLEFYHLLASGYGNVVSCGFYDLKESKIVPEAFLHEKLAILTSNIKDLLNIEEVNFEKCEDTKECLFCEFKIMCGRG